MVQAWKPLLGLQHQKSQPTVCTPSLYEQETERMTQSKKRSGHTADICTAVRMLACKLAPSSSNLQQPATADVLNSPPREYGSRALAVANWRQHVCRLMHAGAAFSPCPDCTPGRDSPHRRHIHAWPETRSCRRDTSSPLNHPTRPHHHGRPDRKAQRARQPFKAGYFHKTTMHSYAWLPANVGGASCQKS